jgi:hypothetical protein
MNISYRGIESASLSTQKKLNIFQGWKSLSLSLKNPKTRSQILSICDFYCYFLFELLQHPILHQ